jgi:hypothetical protein
MSEEEFVANYERIRRAVNELVKVVNPELIDRFNKLREDAKALDTKIRQVRWVELVTREDVYALSRLLDMMYRLDMKSISVPPHVWYVARGSNNYSITFGDDRQFTNAPVPITLVMRYGDNIRFELINAIYYTITMYVPEPDTIKQFMSENVKVGFLKFDVMLNSLSGADKYVLRFEAYGNLNYPYDFLAIIMNEALTNALANTLNEFKDGLENVVFNELSKRLSMEEKYMLKLKAVADKLLDVLGTLTKISEIEEF